MKNYFKNLAAAAIPALATRWAENYPSQANQPNETGARLANMKALPTRNSYSSFQMADQKIGDDCFDAACAGVYSLLTRGLADAPAVIQRRTTSREDLLGEHGLVMLN